MAILNSRTKWWRQQLIYIYEYFFLIGSTMQTNGWFYRDGAMTTSKNRQKTGIFNYIYGSSWWLNAITGDDIWWKVVWIVFLFCYLLRAIIWSVRVGDIWLMIGRNETSLRSCLGKTKKIHPDVGSLMELFYGMSDWMIPCPRMHTKCHSQFNSPGLSWSNIEIRWLSFIDVVK